MPFMVRARSHSRCFYKRGILIVFLFTYIWLPTQSFVRFLPPSAQAAACTSSLCKVYQICQVLPLRAGDRRTVSVASKRNHLHSSLLRRTASIRLGELLVPTIHLCCGAFYHKLAHSVQLRGCMLRVPAIVSTCPCARSSIMSRAPIALLCTHSTRSRRSVNRHPKFLDAQHYPLPPAIFPRGVLRSFGDRILDTQDNRTRPYSCIASPDNRT
ncbi:hypothetical protein B0H16DRAFT_431807 [Mycena metata]|uniref:Uncharacterized protein n=1 Tax=Mycena metata TaxID=1033252 RepID=A0AAD7JLC3_9AGAR|nr:hypothetical protein B0H16DRAFT_431807 [Mycena metata]